MINITLLGTSSLVPLPDRAETAAVLQCGGHSILFDCGEGTQTAARKAGTSLMKTDVIALTHYHGDHIFGLPGLLQTMMVMGRTEKLYIIGPTGIQTAMAPIFQMVGEMSYEIKLLEAYGQEVHLAELIPGWMPEAKLRSFQTEHRVPSCGYIFELGRAGKFLPDKAKEMGIPLEQWGILQKGGILETDRGVIRSEMVMGKPRKGLKFVFSGDTCLCDSLVEAARGADLLVCDATYGENEQLELAEEHGHMNFAQAAEVGARSGAKELWLAHYSQMIDDPTEYLPNAKTIFENTICGVDGLSTILRFEN